MFRALTALLIVAAAVVLDLAAGWWDRTGTLRETAGMFRGEAAPLRLRTRNLVPGLDHLYRLDERPPDDTTMPRGAPRRFRTDAAGLVRGPTPASRGAPDSGRTPPLTVLFLGGSTTEANQVDEAMRFPAAVGARLTERLDRPVRALNGGVRGHTSRDSANALLNHPAYEGAAIVVLMHNINDRLYLARRGGYEAALGRAAQGSDAALGAAVAGLVHATLDWATYRSNLVYLLRTRGFGYNPWTGHEDAVYENQGDIDFPDPNPQRSASRFRRNLGAFVALARATGRAPVLMTQPLGRPSAAQESFNAETRNVANAEGVPLIDLAARLPLDRGKLFLHDQIHFNNTGSLAAADIIAETLAGWIGAGRLPEGPAER